MQSTHFNKISEFTGSSSVCNYITHIQKKIRVIYGLHKSFVCSVTVEKKTVFLKN